MVLRKKFLPTRLSDVACFLLIFTFVPITFVFELFVVLPEFQDAKGYFLVFNWIVGLFVVFNLLGNMLAVMMVDTSIRAADILRPPTNLEKRKQWILCSDCEILSPPRSWHCFLCKTCILKRDHHCWFTGCCVGHCNQRYFVCFTLYVAIGAAYTSIFNLIYLFGLHSDTYANWQTLRNMLLPMLMLTVEVSWENLYLLIVDMNLIAFAYATVLVVYHAPLVLSGSVAYEKNAQRYDLGWKKNLEMIMGKRMKWVWLCPFLESKLEHDGVHWDTVTKQTLKSR